MEESFEITIDDAWDDKETGRIEVLKGLLQKVRVNRHAIGIVRALDAGEKSKAAEITFEANREKIELEELKAAFRAQKKIK
jgi:hypothetical protein